MANASLPDVVRNIRATVSLQRNASRDDRELLHDYVTHKDHAAFAELLRRHGGRILGTCRRVLGSADEADDAFQAVSLVLACKASTIKNGEALAGWLHGVSYRVAMKAKRDAARRRKHERRTTPRKNSCVGPDWEAGWRELQAVLDEEVHRLAPTFRDAFVLCCLEGMSKAEAARELNVKEGTLSSRLARARQCLRQMLARRGISLATVLAGLAVSSNASASVSKKLLETTVSATMHHAAGSTVDVSGFSATALILAEGAMRTMINAKIKIATVLVLVLGLIGLGTAVWSQRTMAGSKTSIPTAPVVEKRFSSPIGQETENGDDEKLILSGQVLGPDGKPAPGAKLFLCDEKGRSAAPQPTADEHGRFQFKLAPAQPSFSGRQLLATAKGYGCDWAQLTPGAQPKTLTLRLPSDLTIKGRVVDLAGKPVAGAKVQIADLRAPLSGNLDEFLRAWKKEQQEPFRALFLLRKRLSAKRALDQLPSTKTDRAGRFELSGIGLDRMVGLRISGANLATQWINVVTRPDFRPEARDDAPIISLHGPSIRVAVSVSKPIVGVVRDATSRKALAGVRVVGLLEGVTQWHLVEATTDMRGQYQLEGLPKQPLHYLAFTPGPGLPYLHRFEAVNDTTGAEPITVNVTLGRAVLVRGRLTDKVTGKPVRGLVIYQPLANNKQLSKVPGYTPPLGSESVVDRFGVGSHRALADFDGRYELKAPRGPGLLLVRAGDGSRRVHYLNATLAKTDRDPKIYDARGWFLTLGWEGRFPMRSLNAYKIIEPDERTAELTASFVLDPGRKRKLKVLGLDGKPMTGFWVTGLAPLGGYLGPSTTDTLDAQALDLKQPRRVVVFHPDRKLAAVVRLSGAEEEPVQVKLQPTTTVTGRLVDKEGKPLARRHVSYYSEDTWHNQVARNVHKPVLTDDKGRFKLEGIPAGLSFFVLGGRAPTTHRSDSMTLKPGATKELGDLKPL